MSNKMKYSMPADEEDDDVVEDEVIADGDSDCEASPTLAARTTPAVAATADDACDGRSDGA